MVATKELSFSRECFSFKFNNLFRLPLINIISSTCLLIFILLFMVCFLACSCEKKEVLITCISTFKANESC